MPHTRTHLVWPTLAFAILSTACDGGTTPEPPLDGSIEVSLQIESVGLEGVQVRLDDTEGLASPRFAITDVDGDAQFTGLEEGLYEVSLGTVPDHVTVQTMRGQATLDRQRPSTRVAFTGVRKRDAAVSVQVRVEGVGIPDLTVELSGPEERSAVTDVEGVARFEALLRGHYEVRLTGYDPERLAFSETTGGLEANGNQSIGIQFAGTEVPRVPDTPSDFSTEVLDAYSVRLTWVDHADNEEDVFLERRVSGDTDWTALATLAAEATSFDDATVQPATDYEYRLRACNEHGCSEPWVETAASTPEVPPAAPTDLAAAATGATSVGVAWTDASNNELRFEVERRLGASGSWVAMATVGADVTNWADSGLATGTEYGYRVRACNDVGCSDFAGPAVVTTVVVPPAPPTNVSAVAEDYDRVRVSWTDASPDETQFRLQRRVGSANWAELESLPANSTSRLDATVVGSTNYRYRLRACNSAGCSDYSNEASVTTPMPPPNLLIGAAYIIQRVQRQTGDVPLISGVDGLLRVFPLADRGGITARSVKVELFQSGALVQTSTIAPPVATMPTSVVESNLATSWNLAIPSALIQPGLAIRVTVDPNDDFAEGDEADNTYPAGGSSQSLDVRNTPDFDVTFVPVRQSVNNTVGNVDAGNAASYLTSNRKMMPIANDDIQVHAEFVTNQPVLGSDGTGWSAVLSEVAALRTAEGSSRAYYGVVPTTYGGGVAGIGYIGWPISLGWDKSGSRASVAAHEWGHNFGRRHSPGCGAGNPDTAYPHASGLTGAWGIDLSTNALKSPLSTYDLMTYCGPEWISDYVYEQVLDFRGPAPTVAHMNTGPVGEGLLVWGRIEDDELILEPAFAVQAPAQLPARPGRFQIEGRDASGSLFSLSFDPVQVADTDAGEGHFAFVVPMSGPERARLSRITLSDGRRAPISVEAATAGPLAAPGIDEMRVAAVDGGTVDVTWNASRHPMAIVRDASTGEILSFARGGHVRVAPRGAEIEIEFSNGVTTVDRRTSRWR